MATDLRCPECQDNLGKDKENPVDAHCGTCDHSFFNQYGYIDDNAHYVAVQKKYQKRKLPKPDNV
jgi:hypothetical protein